MAASALSLRPYRSIFTMRFILMLQYRTAAVAGFATQCWWGFIKVMVFAAFYRSTSVHQPMSFAQVVSYIWLGQAFLVLLPWFGDPQVAEMVRTGNVSYDRLRPLDTYFFWYFRGMGWMVARVVPRAVMMFSVAMMVIPAAGLADWRLRAPAGLDAAALFIVAMVLAVLLSNAILMLINILVVATLDDRGPNAVATQLVTLLSGSIVPLLFFPDWMHRFLFLQPFAGLVDIPYRIYVGNLASHDALAGLALMAMWTAALVTIGRMLMSRAMSWLQVQGG